MPFLALKNSFHPSSLKRSGVFLCGRRRRLYIHDLDGQSSYLLWVGENPTLQIQFKEKMYIAHEVALTKATKSLWEKRPRTFKFKTDDPELKVDLFQSNRIYALIRSTSSKYYRD